MGIANGRASRRSLLLVGMSSVMLKGTVLARLPGKLPSPVAIVGQQAGAQELQVVGVTNDGGMWHTIRRPNGTWQASFGNVKQQAGDIGPFAAAGCAGGNDELHVVGVTNDGGMWHTIRRPNGTWQAFGNVKQQESNDPGPFVAVGCAEINENLHVAGVTNDGGLWHTIRRPNGTWQPSFGNVTREAGASGAFSATGCGSVNDELHVVGVTNDGGMWHTIRRPNGTWQAFGNVKQQESNDPGPFAAIGCRGVNGELQVVGLTGDGGLWHTIRRSDGTWQPSFGNVTREAGAPGVFSAVGAAAVNNELQVVGVTGDGGMWHTIRHPNGTWQAFGNVKQQESNDPGPFYAAGSAGVG